MRAATSSAGREWRRGCIVCCCGIPAAGKTSFCESASSQAADGLGIEAVHVNFDRDVVCTTTTSAGDDAAERFNPGQWKEGRRRSIERIEKIALDSGRLRPLLILADDVMHYRSMRRELMRIARRAKMGFITVFFPLAEDSARQRNQYRGSGAVPEDVIHKIASSLEPPDPTQCVWEKFVYVVENEYDSSAPPNEIFWSLVERAASQPPTFQEELVTEEQRILDRKTTSSSASHAIDIALRKEIGRVIRLARAKLNPARLKTFAGVCSEARQEVLLGCNSSVNGARAELLGKIARNLQDMEAAADFSHLHDILLG